MEYICEHLPKLLARLVLEYCHVFFNKVKYIDDIPIFTHRSGFPDGDKGTYTMVLRVLKYFHTERCLDIYTDIYASDTMAHAIGAYGTPEYLQRKARLDPEYGPDKLYGTVLHGAVGAAHSNLPMIEYLLKNGYEQYDDLANYVKTPDPIEKQARFALIRKYYGFAACAYDIACVATDNSAGAIGKMEKLLKKLTDPKILSRHDVYYRIVRSTPNIIARWNLLWKYKCPLPNNILKRLLDLEAEGYVRPDPQYTMLYTWLLEHRVPAPAAIFDRLLQRAPWLDNVLKQYPPNTV